MTKHTVLSQYYQNDQYQNGVQQQIVQQRSQHRNFLPLPDSAPQARVKLASLYKASAKRARKKSYLFPVFVSLPKSSQNESVKSGHLMIPAGRAAPSQSRPRPSQNPTMDWGAIPAEIPPKQVFQPLFRRDSIRGKPAQSPAQRSARAASAPPIQGGKRSAWILLGGRALQHVSFQPAFICSYSASTSSSSFFAV